MNAAITAAGAFPPAALPRASGAGSKNANATSGRDTSVAASPEPRISPAAKTLTEFYAAASARTQTPSRLLERLTSDGSKFATLSADRFKPMVVESFTDNDKKLLGEAYRLAGGNEEDLRRLDKLAGELGALRLRQRLNGELLASVAPPREDLNGDGRINVDDAPYEVEVAHLAILDEMKRLAEKKHMSIELFF